MRYSYVFSHGDWLVMDNKLRIMATCFHEYDAILIAAALNDKNAREINNGK
jgi:hypothetical protein